MPKIKTKTRKTTPTPRHQKALEYIVENRGTIKSKGEVLKSVGYGPSTVTNPSRVFEAKGFLQLLDKAGLSDTELCKTHNTLLKKSKDEIKIKALDMAYKVKGHYSPEKSVNYKINIDI